jgi:hypothetical protein
MIRSIRRLVKKMNWLSFLVMTFLGSSLSLTKNITDKALE